MEGFINIYKGQIKKIFFPYSNLEHLFLVLNHLRHHQFFYIYKKKKLFNK